MCGKTIKYVISQFVSSSSSSSSSFWGVEGELFVCLFFVVVCLLLLNGKEQTNNHDFALRSPNSNHKKNFFSINNDRTTK